MNCSSGPVQVTAIADDIAQGIRTEQEEEKQRKRAKYMPVPGSAVRRSSRSAAQVAAVKLKQAVASSGTDSGKHQCCLTLLIFLF